MFTRGMGAKRRLGAVPVYLNVYDLTPINGYAYWLGLGVYHSGVQVHGVEYAYGAHDQAVTGIFESEPQQCPGFQFRKSILIGRTDMNPRQVQRLMEELAMEYTGNTYNLISKNCNHFCNTVCLRLTSKPIPKWVNRLARIGFLCNCVLPVHAPSVRQKGDEAKGDKERLRSSSTKCLNTVEAKGTRISEGTSSSKNIMLRSLSVGSKHFRKSKSHSTSVVDSKP
ncbi:hypothetical protein LUZ62_043802 [Rhynchospora pubera]|uniref:PPPDE domain-containing protein n=1 Tax=Rhynchospora pubera TaxID=906938 RepID=A0AAV8FNA9_9POAL|nr:hypothetical protein LUZ62_043802 [Rhynchospora pubera]